MEKDCFDRLPDALLLVIFNKVCDARSLTQCISVSKRFASLVFEADTVFVSIPPAKRNSEAEDPSRRNLFKILFSKFIAKPLLHFIAHRSITTDRKIVSSCSPKEVLKHFKQVKTMHIELPSDSDKTGLEGSDSLLKWEARFGSELKSIVIIGATSFQKKIQPLSSDKFSESNGEVLTDNQLKLRVVWTICCLIAASTRHYLLKQLVLKEHHVLENIIASDVCKQGRVFMGKDEIDEMRSSVKSMATTESSSERSRVPDLSMKLWYVPVLDLPETGYIMRGATLVVIRPKDHGQIGSGSEGGLFGFDGEECEKKAFNEAVREMVKMKKSYRMTMDSF
ncbi:unnamed protein product [Dovyalis caffra]|uniref:F-box protein n=1 Tax=Dovyalis caffra TaxID=77055 RepID=A0AAV1RBR4_9ROSI|nr:unnamed protein product [Dovyalis caffra]